VLTPTEIRLQTFAWSIRGYSREQVDAFLKQVALVLENTQEEANQLKLQLAETRSALQSYQHLDALVQQSRQQTEKAAQQLLDAAHQQAQTKLAETELQIKQRQRAAETQLEKVQKEILHLQQWRNQIFEELTRLLETQLTNLREHIINNTSILSSNDIQADQRSVITHTVLPPPDAPPPAVLTADANSLPPVDSALGNQRNEISIQDLAREL
jgi:cell division initiation protein